MMEQSEKKAFRKQMVQRRDAMGAEARKTADALRKERIQKWDGYQSAELLLFYVSYRSEADTIQLIKEALNEERDVAVPKVVGEEMVFYRITEWSDLVGGYRGILEPDTERCEPITYTSGMNGGAQNGQAETGGEVVLPERTILFVPGCAFDETGGRMGYGGGFYDRFIEKNPELLRVALAYEEQLVAEVPREVHDKKVDVIVTEARMIAVGF